MKAVSFGRLTLATAYGRHSGEFTLVGAALVAMGGEAGIRLSLVGVHFWALLSSSSSEDFRVPVEG